MSKLVDRLRSISKSLTMPIGFHPFTAESQRPRMVFILGLSGSEAKEAGIVSDVNADAGLIWNENPSPKIVKQMVEAAGDIPLGILVRGISEDRIGEFASLGCDYLVFDIKAAAAVLDREEVGKILMIEPSLDSGLVRAINSFGVDGVLVNTRDRDPFIAVEHLLVCRRFIELLDKPVMIALPSLVTRAELTNMWQAGVDGVVVSSSQMAQALLRLKEMIGNLPRGARGRRSKVGVVLPHYGASVTGGEDQETEEI